MNDVHKVIPVEKVREALMRSPSGYLSVEETLAAYKDLRKSLSCLLLPDPPKPAIEEPIERWSVAVATSVDGERSEWCLVKDATSYPWVTVVGGGTPRWSDWSHLSDVGAEPSAFDLEGIAAEDARLDGANADTDAFTDGFDAACNLILKDLARLHAEAITGPEKNMLDKAAKAVKHQMDAS